MTNVCKQLYNYLSGLLPRKVAQKNVNKTFNLPLFTIVRILTERAESFEEQYCYPKDKSKVVKS
jgi:hypothetical protein